MGNITSDCCDEIDCMNKKIKKLERKNKELSEQILNVNGIRDNNDKFFYKQNKTQNAGLQNILNLVANKETLPDMKTGRTITHTNKTNINLDLYVTIGGLNPEPLTKIATLTKNGGSHVFNILDYKDKKAIGYNASYNFNVLPEGDKIPTYNAGPTLAEFGTNQIWASSTPNLRDTFDISCVPAGIGNLLCKDGQKCRDKAVNLSKKSGYTQQQAYNYNVGCEIIPPNGIKIPSGNLETVNVIKSKAPYSSDAIGFPLDTAVPKQQTGSAIETEAGNYSVIWKGPIVSLGDYK
jgi:hypothetical protein